MIRRLATLTLVALTFVTTLATAADQPLIAAHRGGAALWPENSLLAFRNAAELGADLLETDVHLTADGEVVIIHDPTLDRTTNGRGPVSAMKMADLAKLRLKAADGKLTDESVPKLTELFDVLQLGSAQLLLEIKVGVNGTPYPGIEKKVVELVRANGLRERVLIMAFEDATLTRVRALDPDVRTVLLVSQARAKNAAGARDAVKWTTAVRANVLGIDHRVLDGEVVSAAHAANVRVAAWTVNTESDLKRVIGLGVDVVISDRPDLARKVAGLE
jgi:glycerophosphoryl diester phosphodiesterase